MTQRRVRQLVTHVHGTASGARARGLEALENRNSTANTANTAGAECPATHPFAYRPGDFNFDHCCESADDNEGSLGINGGPRDDRGGSCLGCVAWHETESVTCCFTGPSVLCECVLA